MLNWNGSIDVLYKLKLTCNSFSLSITLSNNLKLKNELETTLFQFNHCKYYVKEFTQLMFLPVVPHLFCNQIVH